MPSASAGAKRLYFACVCEGRIVTLEKAKDEKDPHGGKCR